MQSVNKQMLSYAVRSLLMMLGGLLVQKNLLTQETADTLAPALVEHLVAIVLIVAPLVWSYFRAQKNLRNEHKTIEIATKSDPNTPVSVVKQRVLNEIRGVN